MTAKYALGVRPSGGVPTLCPRAPTTAHGGRSRPGGTCLPPACEEAAKAAYAPDAGWSVAGLSCSRTITCLDRETVECIQSEGTCPTGRKTSGGHGDGFAGVTTSGSGTAPSCQSVSVAGVQFAADRSRPPLV